MVEQNIRGASFVIASDLTLIESDRALIRAHATGRIRAGEAAECRQELAAAARHWEVLHLEGEIVARARQPFPHEPIRALDALHLACSLVVRAAVPAAMLLSLDPRVRAATSSLGLPLLPA